MHVFYVCSAAAVARPPRLHSSVNVTGIEPPPATLAEMENYNLGDLADVVRFGAGGGRGGGGGGELPPGGSGPDWQFAPDPGPPFSSADDGFGDPFSDSRDPLLHELDMGNFMTAAGAAEAAPESRAFFSAVEDEDGKKRKGGGGVFSRMLRISPDAAAGGPSPSSPSLLCSSDVISGGGGGTSRGCLVDATTTTSHGIQIPSPRNPASAKRR